MGEPSNKGMKLEDLVLSAEELRRLRQGSASVRETRRYLIVSRVTPGFAFYYNVTDHGFGFNRPEQATLFHQRKQAEAVAALLGFGIEVVRCRTQVRKGARVPLVTPGLRERGARRRTGAVEQLDAADDGRFDPYGSTGVGTAIVKRGQGRAPLAADGGQHEASTGVG
jgi:hypothetical protein